MIWLLGCLSAKKVTDIAVVSPDLDDTLALCPGVAQPLEVELALKGGKTKHTRGKGRGHVAWREVELLLDGRVVDGVGVELPKDPRTSFGKTSTLEVRLADRPELSRTYTVVPRYDCAYVLDLRGTQGAHGDGGGWDEVDGEDGAPASVDEDGDYQGYGQDGQAGRSGRDGAHGSDGGPGSTARVFVYAHQDLVQVKVEASVLRDGKWKARTRRFLVDPQGGSLIVDVRGGDGGEGEDGQDGGDGGMGGEGDPPGRHGAGGHGGHGGDGGDGGPGGTVEFFIDPGALEVLELFEARYGGGAGGLGGNGGSGGGGDTVGQEGGEGRAGRDGPPGAEPTTTEDFLKPLF